MKEGKGENEGWWQCGDREGEGRGGKEARLALPRLLSFASGAMKQNGKPTRTGSRFAEWEEVIRI